jgi:MoxR-like ATPase
MDEPSFQPSGQPDPAAETPEQNAASPGREQFPENVGSPEYPQPAERAMPDQSAEGTEPRREAQLGPSQEALDHFGLQLDRVRDQINQVVLGQGPVLEHLLTALLCGGNVLVEGVPGIAKTLLAKLLSRSLQLDYSRIQFTPDLMPSDVIGTSVYDMTQSRFQFQRGPVFAQVVLIDEINRAPAKTQSALFEVMEERQITYDGVRYALAPPFFVVATQNPIEQEGTYRLPEAQLDRFLFRVRMTYPSVEEEQRLLRRFRDNYAGLRGEQVAPMLSAQQILDGQALAEQVHIADSLCDYVAAIVSATRNNPGIYLGASPRASLALLRASKTYAMIGGRSFVTPEDVQAMAYLVLNHRILLTSDRELEGVEPEHVIREILETLEVPR